MPPRGRLTVLEFRLIVTAWATMADLSPSETAQQAWDAGRKQTRCLEPTKRL